MVRVDDIGLACMGVWHLALAWWCTLLSALCALPDADADILNDAMHMMLW